MQSFQTFISCNEYVATIVSIIPDFFRIFQSPQGSPETRDGRQETGAK